MDVRYKCVLNVRARGTSSGVLVALYTEVYTIITPATRRFLLNICLLVASRFEAAWK